MAPTRFALFGMLAVLAGPARATAQATPTVPPPSAKASTPAMETQGRLAKEAKITLAAATATALKEVPGGTVTEYELEREKGRLIYSFDIKLSGKSGVEEVAVDAITGAMVEHSHESPAAEAKEAAKEAKKPAAKHPEIKKP